MKILPPVSIEARRLLPSRWDVLAALLVLGFIVLFADASRTLVAAPVVPDAPSDFSLDPANLPGYALRTALRMLIALGVSLVFTFTYATWAAKSQRAGNLLVPAARHPAIGADPGLPVDHVVFFLSLAPGRDPGRRARLGLRHFHQPGLEHGVQLLPVAAHRARGTARGRAHVRHERLGPVLADRGAVRPAAADLEHDDVDVRRLVLRRPCPRRSASATPPSRCPASAPTSREAIVEKNLPAIFWAIGAMLVVILIYDQLLFRPLVAWADRFRFDNEDSRRPAGVLGCWTCCAGRALMDRVAEPFHVFMRWTYRLSHPVRGRAALASADRAVACRRHRLGRVPDRCSALSALWQDLRILAGAFTWGDVFDTLSGWA